MKLIIAGSRGFKDFDRLCEELAIYLGTDSVDEVVSGNAKGADTLGEDWAEHYKIPIAIFKPDWNKYGRAAGIRRNVEMAQYADEAIVFWDGRSQGTHHMIKAMKRINKPIKVIIYE